jgi:hypothetical protein
MELGFDEDDAVEQLLHDRLLVSLVRLGDLPELGLRVLVHGE